MLRRTLWKTIKVVYMLITLQWATFAPCISSTRWLNSVTRRFQWANWTKRERICVKVDNLQVWSYFEPWFSSVIWRCRGGSEFSSDQFHPYNIWLAIVTGKLDSDFSMVEVGPIVHSRWLTLACRILRRCGLEQKPSTAFVTLTKFCVQVYSPS